MATKADIARAKANKARRTARATKGAPSYPDSFAFAGNQVGMRPGQYPGDGGVRSGLVPEGRFAVGRGVQRTDQFAVQPQPGYPMAQVPGGGYGVALVPFQQATAPGEPVIRTTSDVLGDARRIVEARDPQAVRPVYGSAEWHGFWGSISGYEDELMNLAGEGSEFTRVRNGWRVKFMDGGATILSSGPTIIEAILAHGEQIDHEATARVQRAADARRIAAIQIQQVQDVGLVAAAASPQESTTIPGPATPVDETGMTKAQIKASRSKTKKQAAIDAKAARKGAVVPRGRAGYRSLTGGYVEGSALRSSGPQATV